MFRYWTDLKLVGFGTSFGMVLPEPYESEDFISRFLTIPVFGSCIPYIYYYTTRNGRSEKNVITREELTELMKEKERPIIYIDMNCKIMDALSMPVQRHLYRLSNSRVPHEMIYGNVERPCMAPLEYPSGHHGNMTVILTIMPPGTKGDYPCFSLSNGPGFYYEYAMYIMEYLRNYFPGLGTVGEINRDEMWTDGSSYTNSIYNYEKIQMPIRFGIEHTLRRLGECDIVRSYKKYYHDGWKYDRISQFRMVNLPEEYPRKELIYFFSEYVDHVVWVLQQRWDTYRTICATATHIMLPKPERYGKSLETMTHLKKRLMDVKDSSNDSHYCGYLAFANIDQQIVGEFRVPWYMKSYLLMLLDLKNQGKIDQIKSQMYHKQMLE